MPRGPPRWCGDGVGDEACARHSICREKSPHVNENQHNNTRPYWRPWRLILCAHVARGIIEHAENQKQHERNHMRRHIQIITKNRIIVSNTPINTGHSISRI
jgi:hypothetical protein